jgi:hypothetical protein
MKKDPVNVIWDGEYWSKADAFLMPLTGLRRNLTYEPRAYLFWNEYSIENYNLIVRYDYPKGDYDKFLAFCQDYLFPTLDKKGYLVESHDLNGETTIFVLDIAEWAKDIELFLSGKYSKIGREAKELIERYHFFNKASIPVHIYAVLYPKMRMAILEEDKVKYNPIEYVSKYWNLDLDLLNQVGEIGSKYDRMEETLLTNVDDFCQDVSK